MFRIESVSKIFRTSRGEVVALDNIDMQFGEGEFVVVRGPSGSGKTTLLLTMGGMLRPTKGAVIMADKDIYAMSDRERASFRAGNVGFVFQMFNLVPYLNARENVLLPAAAGPDRSWKFRAGELLKRLGLSERENHMPSEMSVGQRQRTAIARALIVNPKIILADEPTGNLDSENADEVIRYLDEFHRGGGTVVLATHKAEAEGNATRIYRLEEGRITNH